jgi:hypothetical protein
MLKITAFSDVTPYSLADRHGTKKPASQSTSLKIEVACSTYVTTPHSTVKLYIFKYKQQDATLHNSFISAKCSICFRRFLRPSSGDQKLYIQHLVSVKPLLLPFAVVEELELHDSER